MAVFFIFVFFIFSEMFLMMAVFLIYFSWG